MATKRTRQSREQEIQQLLLASENICSVLRSASNADEAFVAGLQNALGKIRMTLEQERPPLSEIATGLRQGIRDLRTMSAHGLPTEVRKKIGEIAEAVLAGGRSRTLQAIIAIRNIRNSDEFYIVRARLDEIEGLPQFEAEANQLYRLLDSYEEI